GHRFVGGLDGARIQLYPAAVRQFYEAPRGRLQPLEIGRGQLHSFLFPLGGNREPVYAAALDNQFGTQLPLRKEQSLKSGVAEIFGSWPVRPGRRQNVEKIFVRVADPQSGLRSEPVESPQPLGRGVEPGVVKDFRLFNLAAARAGGLPLVSVPLPDAPIAFTHGEQAEADRVVIQFDDELWSRGVSHAKLLPTRSIPRSEFAQVRKQPMAQLPDGQRRALRPSAQQILWWRIP